MAEQTPAQLVRILINDPLVDGVTPVFSDDEITAFLQLEADNVKRAAAQAIDTIADNEALASKVIRDHQLTTDGAKLADALRKRAAALRAQADREDDLADDSTVFELIPARERPAEHTEPATSWWP